MEREQSATNCLTDNETEAEKHPELYKYLRTLDKEQLIELIKIDCYNNHEKDKLKQIDNYLKLSTKEELIIVLIDNLSNYYLPEQDTFAIIRCKEALKRLQAPTTPATELQETPNQYENIKLIHDEDDEIFNISKNDLLGIFLYERYNIFPLNNVFLNDIEDEKTQPTIIKVIEKNIKFSHVLREIENYINGNLWGQKDDIFVLGEVAKKFNLNFRIHTYNNKTKKEEILRKDNDGWIIKKKATQTKYEVSKIGDHYFTYETLNIPKYCLNDYNKLFAYLMVIGFEGLNKINKNKRKADNTAENNGDYENITSLELVNTLKNNQLIGCYFGEEHGKKVKKLTYLNDTISNHGSLNFEFFLSIFETLAKNMYIIDDAKQLTNN